ncbi:MAG TPA: hypothetical protein VLZ73_00435 [Brevundimonas sp.]|nr:hypothetical protein [Brevundimonas sp.]
MTGPLVWPVRIGLFLTGFAAPMAAYWIALAVGIQGTAAMDKVPWGLPVTGLAALLFALTIRRGRKTQAGWAFVFITAALAGWMALLFLTP